MSINGLFFIYNKYIHTILSHCYLYRRIFYVLGASESCKRYNNEKHLISQMDEIIFFLYASGHVFLLLPRFFPFLNPIENLVLKWKDFTKLQDMLMKFCFLE